MYGATGVARHVLPALAHVPVAGVVEHATAVVVQDGAGRLATPPPAGAHDPPVGAGTTIENALLLGLNEVHPGPT
jgi:hypothetical protein